MTREIKEIIIHCSATPPTMDIGAETIDKWHREKGWSCIGYHYIIRLDGTLEEGRPLTLEGAHCKNHNRKSIGICYIGGIDANGKPADTRTEKQKKTLRSLVRDLAATFHCKIYGHCDFANKDCPCFDATKEYKEFSVYSKVS